MKAHSMRRPAAVASSHAARRCRSRTNVKSPRAASSFARSPTAPPKLTQASATPIVKTETETKEETMSKSRKIGLAVAQMGPVHLADDRQAVVRRLVDMLKE